MNDWKAYCLAPFLKHATLINKVYPSKPGHEGARSSSLSYLVYYAEHRPEKLSKVGKFLERKCKWDVAKERNGYHRVTLEILNALIEDCKEHLNYFAYSIISIIYDILQLQDHDLITQATSTYIKFNVHYTGALAFDDDFENLYQALLDKYISFCGISHGKSENLLAGLEAVKSVAFSSWLLPFSVPTLPKILKPLLAQIRAITLEENRNSAAKASKPKTPTVPPGRRESTLSKRLLPSSVKTSIFQDLITDDELARIAAECISQLVQTANAASIDALLNPIFDCLDTNSWWDPVDFPCILLRALAIPATTQVRTKLMSTILAMLCRDAAVRSEPPAITVNVSSVKTDDKNGLSLAKRVALIQCVGLIAQDSQSPSSLAVSLREQVDAILRHVILSEDDNSVINRSILDTLGILLRHSQFVHQAKSVLNIIVGHLSVMSLPVRKLKTVPSISGLANSFGGMAFHRAGSTTQSPTDSFNYNHSLFKPSTPVARAKELPGAGTVSRSQAEGRALRSLPSNVELLFWIESLSRNQNWVVVEVKRITLTAVLDLHKEQTKSTLAIPGHHHRNESVVKNQRPKSGLRTDDGLGTPSPVLSGQTLRRLSKASGANIHASRSSIIRPISRGSWSQDHDDSGSHNDEDVNARSTSPRISTKPPKIPEETSKSGKNVIDDSFLRKTPASSLATSSSSRRRDLLIDTVGSLVPLMADDNEEIRYLAFSLVHAVVCEAPLESVLIAEEARHVRDVAHAALQLRILLSTQVPFNPKRKGGRRRSLADEPSKSDLIDEQDPHDFERHLGVVRHALRPRDVVFIVTVYCSMIKRYEWGELPRIIPVLFYLRDTADFDHYGAELRAAMCSGLLKILETLALVLKCPSLEHYVISLEEERLTKLEAFPSSILRMSMSECHRFLSIPDTWSEMSASVNLSPMRTLPDLEEVFKVMVEGIVEEDILMHTGGREKLLKQIMDCGIKGADSEEMLKVPGTVEISPTGAPTNPSSFSRSHSQVSMTLPAPLPTLQEQLSAGNVTHARAGSPSGSQRGTYSSGSQSNSKSNDLAISKAMRRSHSLTPSPAFPPTSPPGMAAQAQTHPEIPSQRITGAPRPVPSSRNSDTDVDKDFDALLDNIINADFDDEDGEMEEDVITRRFSEVMRVPSLIRDDHITDPSRVFRDSQ